MSWRRRDLVQLVGDEDDGQPVGLGVRGGCRTACRPPAAPTRRSACRGSGSWRPIEHPEDLDALPVTDSGDRRRDRPVHASEAELPAEMRRIFPACAPGDAAGSRHRARRSGGQSGCQPAGEVLEDHADACSGSYRRGRAARPGVPLTRMVPRPWALHAIQDLHQGSMPAPFSPTSACTVPRRTEKVMSAGHDPGKSLGDSETSTAMITSADGLPVQCGWHDPPIRVAATATGPRAAGAGPAERYRAPWPWLMQPGRALPTSAPVSRAGAFTSSTEPDLAGDDLGLEIIELGHDVIDVAAGRCSRHRPP